MPRSVEETRPALTHRLAACSWLYLALFNLLWVVFPLWVLYEAYQALGAAMTQAEMVDLVKYLKKA